MTPCIGSKLLAYLLFFCRYPNNASWLWLNSSWHAFYCYYEQCLFDWHSIWLKMMKSIFSTEAALLPPRQGMWGNRQTILKKRRMCYHHYSVFTKREVHVYVISSYVYYWTTTAYKTERINVNNSTTKK